MDSLERRETQTSSHTSEMMGLDESAEFAQEKETWGLGSRVTESNTEWTDEKHRLYLKSMEASFVNQLYNSMDIPGWKSLKKRNDVTSSWQMHVSPSGQFKVLRGGCWQRINFERPEFHQNKEGNSRRFLASPWIRHFKPECKSKTLASPNPPGIAGSKIVINLSGKKTVSCEAASSSEHIDPSYSCHHELVDSNAEVSDQNFVDEEIKGEKVSSICSSKKMKTAVPYASGHDQVVPLPHNKLPMTENCPEKCVFPAR